LSQGSIYWLFGEVDIVSESEIRGGVAVFIYAGGGGQALGRQGKVEESRQLPRERLLFSVRQTMVGVKEGEIRGIENTAMPVRFRPVNPPPFCS
jgi:hypothetical protein